MPPELTAASAVLALHDPVADEEHGSITLGEAVDREERGEPLPPEIEEHARKLSAYFQRALAPSLERAKLFQQAWQKALPPEKARRIQRTFEAWQQLPEHEREHWNERRVGDAATYREIQARLRSLATATPARAARSRAPRRRNVRTAARRARAPASRSSGDTDPEPSSRIWLDLAVASRRMLEHERRREARWRKGVPA